MAQKTPIKKEGNKYFQIVFVAALILGSLAYFGNFWAKALREKSDQPQQEVLSTQEVAQENAPSQQESQEISNKTEKPVVELFVMSFCPYGNLAEDTLYPVVELLQDKVDWRVHYIVSESSGNIVSSHGEPEVLQNERELCVKELYDADKFWKFVTQVNSACGTTSYDSSGKILAEAGACWAEVALELSLDTNNITTCVSNNGASLLGKEIEITEENNVSGSPTLFINGIKDSQTVYQYGNSEAYKNLICSAFVDRPEECNSELASSTVGTSGSCN